MKTEPLACKCGDQAIQSADMEFKHPKSNEFRSLYFWHCMADEDECGMEGPKSYDPEESTRLWNEHVRNSVRND